MIPSPWFQPPASEADASSPDSGWSSWLDAVRLRHLGIALGTVFVLSLVALIQLSWSLETHSRARQLQLEKQALVSELTDIRTKVTSLESTVEDVQGREYQVRSLAGLRPMDDDVFEAGIGGLSSGRPEDLALFAFDPDAASEAFALDYDIEALQRRARVLLDNLEEVGDSLTDQRDRLLALPTLFPTVGRVSSRFSRARLHPIMNEVLPHPGLDIAAPRGTPILAAGHGRVVRAGWNSGYGQMVEIDHGRGYSTIYAHASRILVRAGQQVERGDVIAQVGSTGIATASHLHYEVRMNGQQQNPANFFLPGTSR
jgi:murein DD-endopeptidase MepM/ murein hydrolase activator NlpD